MLRVGVCGLGSAARRAHLPALSRGAETGVATIGAVTDPDPGRRDLVARHTGARAFAGVEELLDAGAIDLLVIASPPSSHLAAVRGALERGIDVLCEKPLGVAPGDVGTLSDLCAAHPGVLLAPVHQYRFAPAWSAIEAAVGAALVEGEPVSLAVEVERPGTDPLSSGGWRAAGLREGGILGDHAVHYLALAWTLGAPARVTTAVLAGDPGRETGRIDLELGRPDATASIAVSYAGEERRNLVAAELPARGGRLRWLDGELSRTTAAGCPVPEATLALSDRQAVNDLYVALYDDLLAGIADPAWRRRRVEETLDVARLLDASLAAVR